MAVFILLKNGQTFGSVVIFSYLCSDEQERETD